MCSAVEPCAMLLFLQRAAHGVCMHAHCTLQPGVPFLFKASALCHALGQCMRLQLPGVCLLHCALSADCTGHDNCKHAQQALHVLAWLPCISLASGGYHEPLTLLAQRVVGQPRLAQILCNMQQLPEVWRPTVLSCQAQPDKDTSHPSTIASAIAVVADHQPLFA